MMNDFDKYNIIDEITPINIPLTAHYKRSFAFYTIADRLPRILTQIIDHLSQDKDGIANEFGNGEKSKDDIKEIIAKISKLKYELQTDKELLPFSGNQPDKDIWNTLIETLGENNTYFTASWLDAECYMYRRVYSFFEDSVTLQSFDYFRKKKLNAIMSSELSMVNALKQIAQFKIDYKNIKSKSDLYEYFIKIMKLNLWSNRFDLSISVGASIKQIDDPFMALDSYDDCLLINRCQDIWDCILSPSSSPSTGGGAIDNNNNITIDIILDNDGFELFTDFIVADFLLENQLASKIRFHVKQLPWFISDVTKNDLQLHLDTLKQFNATAVNGSLILKEFAEKIENYHKNKQLEYCFDQYFWTLSYDFNRMQDIAPLLYERLCESHLLIFKGDLNYRKLLGDLNWCSNTKFSIALRDFHPTNLCTLRTVKADVICEIDTVIADYMNKTYPDWMKTGKYGVIQFYKKT